MNQHRANLLDPFFDLEVIIQNQILQTTVLHAWGQRLRQLSSRLNVLSYANKALWISTQLLQATGQIRSDVDMLDQAVSVLRSRPTDHNIKALRVQPEELERRESFISASRAVVSKWWVDAGILGVVATQSLQEQTQQQEHVIQPVTSRSAAKPNLALKRFDETVATLKHCALWLAGQQDTESFQENPNKSNPYINLSTSPHNYPMKTVELFKVFFAAASTTSKLSHLGLSS